MTSVARRPRKNGATVRPQRPSGASPPKIDNSWDPWLTQVASGCSMAPKAFKTKYKSGVPVTDVAEMIVREQQAKTTWETTWFEEELQANLKEMEATESDFQLAKACVRQLQRAASLIQGHWCVKPFGSFSNGFATRGSDLDITCCWCGDPSPEQCTPNARDVMCGMMQVLQSDSSFQVLEEVNAAMVPILRMKFCQQLNVELSFKNAEPLRNTQLLRAYASLAPCHTSAKALGMLVKTWAKAEGLCDVAAGNLSSYSFLLMAIYYLQVDSDVSLPCLPTRAFDGGDNIPEVMESWQCPLPIGVLLQRFFTFFAWEFQWGEEVVSIRCGHRLKASHRHFFQLRGRLEQRFHIEDPFLIGRNLNRVMLPQQEAVLHTKFCEAAQEIQSGRLPHGLLHNSRAEHQPILQDGGLTDFDGGLMEFKSGWGGDCLGGPWAWRNSQQLDACRHQAAAGRMDRCPQEQLSWEYEPAPEDLPATLLSRKHAARVQ